MRPRDDTARRATRDPSTWKQIRLSVGSHKFEYYHAAATANAIMLAAWIAHPVSPKEHPTAIGGEAFTTYLVAHLPAGRVTTRTAKLVPDFLVKIAGEVPLPDDPLPMLGVAFRDASARSLSMQGKPLWDFGDGQTSTSAGPNHVYLRPGLYTVKLIDEAQRAAGRDGQSDLCRSPPAFPQDKPHTLNQYLGIIENYEPRTLDVASLRQLVSAYEGQGGGRGDRQATSGRGRGLFHCSRRCRPGRTGRRDGGRRR